MVSKIFVFSTMLGVIAASQYGGASNSNPSYQSPSYNNRPGWGWGGWDRSGSRSSSSSSSEERRWDCPRIRSFNSSDPLLAPYFSKPTIGYFTRNGEERAIIICDGPQIQDLVAQSPGANPSLVAPNNDIALLSKSTRSGLVLKCERNHRRERFTGLNLLSNNKVPVYAVACVTVPDAVRTTFFTAIAPGLIL